MKDDFDRLFHPRAFKTKWAELSINQGAFKHVGHKEIELEEIDEAGNTAFHLAASKDFLPISDIRPFISGANVDHRKSNPENKEGRTPLHIAAEKGHLTFCQMVWQGCQWRSPSDKEEKQLKKELPFLQNFKNFDNWNPMCSPNVLNDVMYGDGSLIDKVYNPADNVGMTPLHLAAKSGHLSICKELLDNILDLNPKNEEGATPLHLAAAEGHLDICHLMLKLIRDDKNPKDHHGSTPLHHAASKGHVHVCRLFLQIAEDKNPMNNFGLTPLHLADKHGHLQIVEIYVKNLKGLNEITKNKVTPLHFAANNGLLEVAKMLMKNMKIKNPKDNQGLTPLHLAAKAGHSAVFELIFDQISKPENMPTDRVKNPPEHYGGNTPFHFAVRAGRTSIVETILNNADLEWVHPQNRSGQTPLDLADGHKQILRLFRKNNCDILPMYVVEIGGKIHISEYRKE